MYSILQKIICSLLLSVSILLSGLALWNALHSILASQPPFTTEQAVPGSEPQDVHYTAAELGISGTNASLPSGLHAKAACLMDADSERVLFGQAEDEPLPMASTTKIMTCILTLEQGNLADEVTFSSYAASMPDVQLNAQTGESFVLKDLLYSLMLESHNDTAVAIAEHIGGSVEGFADLMNQKADELGLVNTHFVTPNGLDDNEHYTTAKELCLIAAYALQNESFCEIIRTPSHSFRSMNKNRSFQISNKDAFLNSYNGAIGIKTGFTGNAGYCFCGAATRNGTTLISSVLACGWPPHKTYKWADTRKLMDYGFQAFTRANLPDKPALPTIQILDGTQAELHLNRTVKKELSSLYLNAQDTLDICYELPDSVTAPVRSGDIIGYEQYFLGDTLIYNIPLTAAQEVTAADQCYLRKLLCHLFFCSQAET
ncbi:MAG: D-alanyl-D-alanine carboxypeptidase [Lachnospiraceae bacterium]|nr:D-alanyl-D-alanine carboxypeptidase [Lachnospiraceae bacterium]